MHAAASDTEGRIQTSVNSEEKVFFFYLTVFPPHGIDSATCITKTVVLIQSGSALVPASFCVFEFSFYFQHCFFPKTSKGFQMRP